MQSFRPGHLEMLHMDLPLHQMTLVIDSLVPARYISLKMSYRWFPLSTHIPPRLCSSVTLTHVCWHVPLPSPPSLVDAVGDGKSQYTCYKNVSQWWALSFQLGLFAEGMAVPVNIHCAHSPLPSYSLLMATRFLYCNPVCLVHFIFHLFCLFSLIL